MSQMIDVTGLSPESVRVIERLVARMRESPAESEARWKAAAEAARSLTDYDFDACEEQRAFDLRHEQEQAK